MEQRDLYDKDRNLIGKTISKGVHPPEGTYIQVVLVFIQNSDGKFLIQKRSEVKNGLYATTGGHPKAGESSLQGLLSEVREELGLKLKPKEVSWYYGGRSDEERVFWDDYYAKVDNLDLSKLKIQEEEVDSICWLSSDEIIDLKNQGKFFLNHFDEFEELLKWLKRR